MKRHLLIHYSEIGLKKGNTQYFLLKLRERLKYVLEHRFRDTFVLKHSLGRFLIELPADFVEEDWVEVVSKVFAIRSFSFVYAGSAALKKLGNEIIAHMPKFSKNPASFRVTCKRSMILPFTSSEAERELGAMVLKNGFDVPVKMNGAELIVNVEFFNDHGFFSFKRYEGAGGLPSNSSGKLICLLSSGIDSPVAAYRLMRRGARVIFVHFHGYPYTDKDEMEQVKDLCEVLAQYQFDTKLYLVPFGKIQKAIATTIEIPAKVRTVLYRRLMLRIAETISKKEQAKGLITGDNYGQVASQTPDNMFTIDEAVNIAVYRPLIGYDKEDIIGLSREIGTFEISKIPCKDTCAMFQPKHPELNANPFDMRKYEGLLPVNEWIVESLDGAEVEML